MKPMVFPSGSVTMAMNPYCPIENLSFMIFVYGWALLLLLRAQWRR